MEPRSRFRLQKSWPAVMFVLGAGCVGQDPADHGVESAAQAIQGGKLVPAGEAGFAAKIEQVMSDGKRLICTGAFISPHVVLTAAHCTRNYDYGTTITPTTDTVIRYGAGFASSQKIAGGEKVGWRELGSTDIGLYRVAQAVTLPVTPKLYRNCSSVNLVGGRLVVYGRMINGKQAPTAELYVSPERTVRAIANGVGANGNYVEIDATTDSGDSGGPWVSSQDRIVAVTHTSAYGSRFCDVALEVETQVKEWGDTLVFVEDSGAGGADGGATVRGDAAAKLDGVVTSSPDARGVGGRAGSGGGAGGSSGAGGDVSGSAGRVSSSVPTTSGGTGGVTRQNSTNDSGGSSGGKATGGSAGGLSSSSASASTSPPGGRAGDASKGSGGAQAGAKSNAQASAGAAGRADSATSSGSSGSGCGCRTLGDSRPSNALALLVPAVVIALNRKRRQG